jgi:hypothetical protein
MSTIIGGKDRSDYRTLPTQLLIEEARYTPNVELCVVLAERLQDAERNQRYDRCEECDRYIKSNP